MKMFLISRRVYVQSLANVPFQVARTLFLLLIITSVWPTSPQYSRNLGTATKPSHVCKLGFLLPGSGVAHLVAAERVVVGGAVVAIGAVVAAAVAAVGLLAGVLAHVHLEHGLPRRLVVAHLADVRLQLPVHSLKRRKRTCFEYNFSITHNMD